METNSDKLEHAISILHCLQTDIKLLHTELNKSVRSNGNGLVHLPFKGSEIYLLHKSDVDPGGAPSEIYKTLLEKTGAHISNKTQKEFSG